ncbi:MAG: hypothetical protein JST04_00845 [Bdellovibrionales bacterium]|nr:hypothetical protein [Bdellovibrionales bacterium]
MQILPKLTKQYILDRITQEEIFVAYSKVSLEDIQYCLDSNSLIKSPLRTDNIPTFGFHYTGKILRGQDFAGYFWGDCFDCVAYNLKLDSKNPHNFNIILENIAKAFGIHKYSKSERKIIATNINIIQKVKPQIDYEIRKWTRKDAEFWKYQTRKDLENDGIYPILRMYINNGLIYTHTDNDPCYVYLLGKNKKKLYFPKRNQYKFIGDSVFQGIHNFRPSRYGIITKSYKDVRYLRLFRDKYDLDAIAPGSEKTIITPNQYIYLRTQFEQLFILYDYDNTGIHSAWKHREKYGIEPIFLRDKIWNRGLGYKGCKDFYDVCIKLGLEKAEELIENGIRFYETQRNSYEENFGQGI